MEGGGTLGAVSGRSGVRARARALLFIEFLRLHHMLPRLRLSNRQDGFPRTCQERTQRRLSKHNLRYTLAEPVTAVSIWSMREGCRIETRYLCLIEMLCRVAAQALEIVPDDTFIAAAPLAAEFESALERRRIIPITSGPAWA